MSYYYDDDNEGGGSGIFILFLIIALPILVPGDYSIYLVDTYFKNSPNYVYIIAYIVFAGAWGLFCWKIFSLIFNQTWLKILALYAQGIAFIMMYGNSDFAKFSKIAYSILHSIFIGK